MGHSVRRNPDLTHPVGHSGSKDPTVVMTRDQSADVDDPTAVRGHYPDDTVCSQCGAVVHHQRWTLDESRKAVLLAAGTPHQVICPACRSAKDCLPQGILTLRGGYWPRHRDEIVNLIRNEEADSLRDNPLGRIIDLREEEGCLVVETSNEKLAQKIGRSLHKAHKGETQYHWGDRNQLVRVDWERAN